MRVWKHGYNDNRVSQIVLLWRSLPSHLSQTTRTSVPPLCPYSIRGVGYHIQYVTVTVTLTVDAIMPPKCHSHCDCHWLSMCMWLWLWLAQCQVQSHWPVLRYIPSVYNWFIVTTAYVRWNQRWKLLYCLQLWVEQGTSGVIVSSCWCIVICIVSGPAIVGNGNVSMMMMMIIFFNESGNPWI